MTARILHADIRRGRALLYVLILWALSVLLRLPNLDRPISKHHEYNTAMVLADIDSWRQAGGGARFHFVPLLNYQNPGDLSHVKNAAVDSLGNTLYLSFGPGWYVIPYFFYQLFSLPAEPVYLQVINLFFELAAIVLFFLLLEKLLPAGRSGRYRTTVVACCLFLFSPAVLWYLGNGYVNTGIMLPFLLGVVLLLLPMLRSPAVVASSRLIGLFLLIVVLVYIDWFVIFFSGVICLWMLFQMKKDRRYWIIIGTMGLGCLTGLAIIFFQMASYAGAGNVLLCWSNRFQDRSIAHTSDPVWLMILVIFRHMFTCYFPVLLVMGWSWWVLRSKKEKPGFSLVERRVLGLYAGTVLLYNFVLMDWSFEHEFALMPMSILVSYLGARLLLAHIQTRRLLVVMGIFLMGSIVQYYLINRPGRVSRDGTPYRAYMDLGLHVRSIPLDYKLFMDKKWSFTIDYYAHRNFIMAENIDSAKALVRRYNIPKAVWIQQDNFRFEKAILLR